jgi:hypothetical protein
MIRNFWDALGVLAALAVFVGVMIGYLMVG